MGGGAEPELRGMEMAIYTNKERACAAVTRGTSPQIAVFLNFSHSQPKMLWSLLLGAFPSTPFTGT